MDHHRHHHHHRNEEQSYGADPYTDQGSGYYEGASYPAPQTPAYGYEQQPVGYGGYESGYERDYEPAPPLQSDYERGYEPAQPVPYGAVQTYGGGYGPPQPYAYEGAMQSYNQDGRMQEIDSLRADEQRHRRNEHRSEAVALGAAAFAAYEHHEVKVDPEHADRHRREERIAEATAVGAAGYALYEHQQSRHDQQQLQALGGDQYGNQSETKHHHRHHGFFG